ncbi:MAG: hypothetical protein LBO00_04050 [Zoogloeaceae bacterium]|jgi:hypothetical protein|nr:hypothetical protein [Zoogloeaceae bacterium]
MNAVRSNTIAYTLEEKIQRDITLTPEEARELYERAIDAERELKRIGIELECLSQQAMEAAP